MRRLRENLRLAALRDDVRTKNELLDDYAVEVARLHELDPAETTERFVDGRPQLAVVRRFAVVPQQAGSLVIPAMQVPWWDATSGQPRRALLPALKLEVGASAQA